MRGWSRLVVLLMLGAGCVGLAPAAEESTGAPSAWSPAAKLLDLGAVVEASVPVSGGVALHGTVYLPDVAEGEKVPVIMDLGPYYGNLNGDTSVYSEKHPPNLLYEHFLRNGYAIALMSLRGTGLSGGCFMIGGPEERADAAAAVEWLAAQEWSDGNVAMTGVSYDGTTPWEAYVSGAAPHLKAIVPVEGISDHYRYSFFEGVPVGGGAAFNTYYEALVDLAYLHPAGLPAWLAVQPENLCPEQADVYLNPYHTYRDGIHGPYWDARDASAMVANATAAVFVVHGTTDFNVKMDHVQTIWADLPEPKRMLIGNWYHTIPWRNAVDKDLAWHAYNDTILRFLDAHVRGDPAALAAEQAAPPVLVQDSANRTWGLTAWPPAESVPTRLYLGDGTLAWTPADEGSAQMRGTPAGQLAATAGLPLPDGSVAFATEAFDADALFMGNPFVELNVTVDRPEGQLEAWLYEDTGEGWELVSLGYQNLATRESRDKASDVPTGTPMPVRLTMEGIAEVVEKGHKLVLVLSPVNHETLTPQFHATTFTIALGGEGGASLTLPVFPGERTELLASDIEGVG